MAEPRPALGYAMVWAAALLFGINATVSKVILESGVSSLRLAEARSLGALAVLAVVVAAVARPALRVTPRELGAFRARLSPAIHRSSATSAGSSCRSGL